MESYSYAWFPSKLILVATIFTFFFCFPSSSSASANFSRILAFGDSFTDTGNTNLFSGPAGFGASKLPYGMTFFNKPTGRFSDGRLVIDFVAEALNLPYLPAYLERAKMDTSHGVNFAVAGGTAIEHEYFVMNGITLDITLESLMTQLQWFNTFLEQKGCGGGANTNDDCTKFFDDTLFWVGEIGANDYAYTLGHVSPLTVQQLIIDRVSRFLEEVLKKGAKYVVVQGLPPTGCLALSMTYSQFYDRDDMGCARTANMGIYAHNSQLQNKLQDITNQFPQAIISYADYSKAYQEVMKNTRKYGFQEPFKCCCGSGGGGLYNFNPLATCGSPAASRACSNPSQFINWDGVHLTEAMYKYVADFLLRGGYCHPSFTDLLSRKSQGS